MLVAGDQVDAFGDGREDGLALGFLAGLAGLDLDQLDGREAERPASGLRARDIVERQRALWRPSEFTDRDQRDLQVEETMWLESTDQIFSIW